jgi:hypothetical protein
MSRVRNDHTFVLWALITTAVAYGGSQRGANNFVGLFFGKSFTFKTLLSKTRHLCDVAPFFRRVDQAVESVGWTKYLDSDGITLDLFVVLSYFDSSQRNTHFKFRRGGSSGNMVRLTSRAMERPWSGPWRHMPIPSKLSVLITYVDQVIPSPFGMACFERLLDPSFASSFLAQVIVDANSSDLLPSSGDAFFYSTGQRVKDYMMAVFVSCNLRLLHRHLSRGIRYKFCPEDYIVSSSLSSVTALLKGRRGRHDVLHWGASFLQRCSVTA